jgi:hypothetical protein
LACEQKQWAGLLQNRYRNKNDQNQTSFFLPVPVKAKEPGKLFFPQRRKPQGPEVSLFLRRRQDQKRPYNTHRLRS